mgnify:CR=1 FL=1
MGKALIADNLKVSNSLFAFILLIPLINAIATLFTGYFSAGSVNPGTIRATILGVFFIYFLTRHYPVNKPNIFILILLAYFFALVFLSSNPARSLYIYLRFFIATMMFPAGYYAINNLNRLRKFYLSLMGVLFILITSIVVSNIFGLGTSDYLDESFYFGEYGVNITKNMVVLIMLVPVFFIIVQEKKWRYLGFVLFILVMIFIIVGVKRSALLALASGIIIYLLLSPRKLRSFKIVVISTLFLILISPYFYPLFLARYEARQEQVSMGVEELDEEGRVREFFAVWDNFKNANLAEKMMGSDLFLNRDLWGYGRLRLIHVDYTNLLAGSGLLGLSLFLLMYIAIFNEAKRYYKLSGKPIIAKELFAVLCALFAAHAFLSIGGTITGIDLRGLILINLGAITGTLKSMARERWKKDSESISEDITTSG